MRILLCEDQQFTVSANYKKNYKMKKLLIIAGVIAMVGLATSCKKEKDCVCKTYVGSQQMSSAETTIEDGDCSDLNTSQTVMGMTQKVVCEEK